MNRYQFRRSYVGEGQEAWVWITWVVLIVLTLSTGMFMIGRVSERQYFTPLISGMISQHEAGCESSPWVHKKPNKNKNKPKKKEAGS